MKINSPAEIQDEQYKKALCELLYQLADDDFIIAFRGSEWLGLAPHIEEDIAFSSISQDTMGHAAMYYQLLEDLGEGTADELAHGRASKERKNAIILEEVNGPGHYLREPKYDWAFAVVRNYFYTQAKKIRIDSLKTCSYQPLADLAIKVNTELYYHLLHWKTWFVQLLEAGGEAKGRMETAIQRVSAEMKDALSLGSLREEMVQHSLIESEESLIKRWENALQPIFESSNLSFPLKLEQKKGSGRAGEHTSNLTDALITLSEVYNSDKAASW